MPPPIHAPKRRHTLRYLMLIIALTAVPLAIVHRVMKAREAERQRVLLEQQIAFNQAQQAMVEFKLKHAKPPGASPADVNVGEHEREELRREAQTLRRTLSGIRP